MLLEQGLILETVQVNVDFKLRLPHYEIKVIIYLNIA